MTLVGKVAVVTGASRGLGEAIARVLAREGASLVLAARTRDELEATAQRIREGIPYGGQRVLAMTADVSRPGDAERLLQTACDELGRLDALVCNAGVYGPMGPIEELDWSAWVRALEINLYGTVLCCRAAVAPMRRQGKGKIVTLSGGGATQPLPRLSAYAASKAAVVRFTETLAQELAGSGIDVNAVAPGALNTRLLDEVLAAGPERVGGDFFAHAVQQKEQGGVPLDRGAELVAYLASDASDGITGRLLSAVWDDWQHLADVRKQLEASDVYTLRRIVPSDRGWGTAS